VTRLNAIRAVYDAAMARVRAGTADATDVAQLKSVLAQLQEEFNSYEPDLQKRVQPMYERLVQHITGIITRLEQKLKKGEGESVDAGQKWGEGTPAGARQQPVSADGGAGPDGDHARNDLHMSDAMSLGVS
jgi:hypothetical protein